ncbi:hypothetical protein [Natrinema sp. 1APR25-10V2]|uniref:hypothetical protein n=1 Tax=Natrinema sp. 1APR25-10V2 TaxID=2951081 RepID=UPI00287701BF|nr:hypothetical protein [Natrinema sp. 1APR25-10V2]MDS0473795.1 hypothetical protein [Natrinema sp. 1APR25-10V2]
MRDEFVPASRLYDVESRTPIAHPAHQATDADVRQAFEEREAQADGEQFSRKSIRYCHSLYGLFTEERFCCNSDFSQSCFRRSSTSIEYFSQGLQGFVVLEIRSNVITNRTRDQISLEIFNDDRFCLSFYGSSRRRHSHSSPETRDARTKKLLAISNGSKSDSADSENQSIGSERESGGSL